MPSWKKIIVSGSDAELSSVNVGTGTYNTGLFDTYTPATTVGTAVGDFNNILKALAPAQAPAYSTLGATGSVGQASSVSPTFVGVGGLTYISKPYLSGSGIIANNTTFQKYSDTSNRNYLGAISASRAFSSFRITTNPATTANASTYTNYPNGAFFAQLGTTEETWTLKLNGSQLDSFTVRDANASSSINANFGTFTVGQYKSAQFITTGDNVTNYGSRSGSFTFTIPAPEANLAWNPGLNNFEVTRSVGGTEYKSNTYWLWDPGVNVSITENSVKLLSGSNTGTVYGGIEYLTTAPTLQVTASVDNFYKYSWTAGNVASVALSGSATQTVSTLTSPTYDAVTEVSRSFTLNKSSRYLPSDSYQPVLTSSPALRSSQTLTFSAPNNVVLYDGVAGSSTLVTKRVRKDVGTSGLNVAITNGLVTPSVVYQTAFSTWSNTIVTNEEGVYYNGLVYGAKSSTLDTLWSGITAGTISPSNSSVSSQITTWDAQPTFNFGFYVNRSAVNASDNIPLTITTPSGLSGTVIVDLYYQTTVGGTVYNDSFSTTLATLRSGTTFTFQGTRTVAAGNDVVVVIKNIPSGANTISYISAITAGTGWTI